jgi:hypothetical protein
VKERKLEGKDIGRGGEDDWEKRKGDLGRGGRKGKEAREEKG